MKTDHREDALHWPGCGHARRPEDRACVRCQRQQMPLFAAEAQLRGHARPSLAKTRGRR
jgi:hypothetical protein